MMPIMHPSNESSNQKNTNAQSMIDSKEAALNVAVKRMVESSEMAEAAKEKTDEASILLQEYHKRNCKKVRIMINDDHS